MKVNQYLVLHSGDKILMKRGVHLRNNLGDIKSWESYFNNHINFYLEEFNRDIKESASHIELVLSYKED